MLFTMTTGEKTTGERATSEGTAEERETGEQIMTIGEQIRQAREKKNLSQEELAEYMGVTRQAVSKWENNLSVPQGRNRELLLDVLDLELAMEEAEPVRKRGSVIGRVCLAVGGLLIAGLISIFLYLILKPQDTVLNNEGNEGQPKEADSGREEGEQNISAEPVLKSIIFYDSEQREVSAENTLYNSAKIDSILIQWEGDGAKAIDMYYETLDPEASPVSELFLTKELPEDASAVLLNAEVLQSRLRGQIYFELKFENKTLTSDRYQIEYDPSVLVYIREFDGMELVYDEVEWVTTPGERATELGITDPGSGFYIYNENENTTRVTLSRDCMCYLLDWTDNYQEIQVTPEELGSLLKEREDLLMEGTSVPYWLTLEGEEVIRLSEQYVP